MNKFQTQWYRVFSDLFHEEGYSLLSPPQTLNFLKSWTTTYSTSACAMHQWYTHPACYNLKLTSCYISSIWENTSNNEQISITFYGY